MDAARSLTRRTAERFGFLWEREARETPPEAFHYRLLCSRLPPGHLRGRVLDAGCGAGIDTLHLAEAHDGGLVVGIELSEAGARLARHRTRHLANARVVQGDLQRLAFNDAAFDFVYSYGVLHHLMSPERGFQELVRVLKPGGVMAIYVYEDFQRRAPIERAALAAANSLRALTTRLPVRLLFAGCWVASPLIVLSCAWPAHLLAQVPAFSAVSRRIPFHHGTTPWSLVGDLFDRFAAPIEHRYNASELADWFTAAKLEAVQLLPHRGWLAIGRKPARQVADACAASAAS